jgi:hypothetical protein
MLTTQVLAVPVQAFDQPANVEPLAAVAVRVTEVLSTKLALHVAPQLMPAGLLVTVPTPVPDLLTVNTGLPTTTVLNVAVTAFDVTMLTTQVLAVPVQPFDQPANVDPLAGMASSVTVALGA